MDDRATCESGIQRLANVAFMSIVAIIVHGVVSVAVVAVIVPVVTGMVAVQPPAYLQ